MKQRKMRRIVSVLMCLALILSNFSIPGVHKTGIGEGATAYAAGDNLALGKATLANDTESGTPFTSDKAVDGIIDRGNGNKSRWASNQGSDPKWLRIDFGAPTEFDTVKIFWERTNITSYQVQITDTPDDESSWKAVYSNDSLILTTDETLELGKIVKGRYLRVYVDGYVPGKENWQSVSIFEVEVYKENEVGPVTPEGQYKIYPTPQKIEYKDGTITWTNEVNVIAGDGIDAVTKDRLVEVLKKKNYTVSYSAEPSADKTNLYIGIKGSGDKADSYAGIPKDVFTTGDYHYDPYVLQISKGSAHGDIVILGENTTTAFYGLATLNLILEQCADNTTSTLLVQDYSNLKYRGMVEGFYGYPWSVEGRVHWMDFAKRYKLNKFIYGPKGDPYHLGLWDEDYPDTVTAEQAKRGVLTKNDLKKIAEAAKKAKVDFVWVAHPAMQKPINLGSKETTDAGVTRLMTKFDHLYQLGIREFGVFVDDIPDSTAMNTRTMQAYLIDQVQKKLYEKYNTPEATADQKVKELFFTPSLYTTWGGSVSTYLSAFHDIHPDIVVCFTGSGVFSNVADSFAETYGNWLGRKPCMWWNYPVNDNGKDSQYYTYKLDSYYSLDKSIPHYLGIVSNPMSFSEASKVSHFGLADYTWNPAAFRSFVNWEDSADAIAPGEKELANAIRIVYRNLPKDLEPGNLKKLYKDFETEWPEGTKTAALALLDEMKAIREAIEYIRNDAASGKSEEAKLIVAETTQAMDKLCDMVTVIEGAMKALTSDDANTRVQGYYDALQAYSRITMLNNPRYNIRVLKGAGENFYYNDAEACPSDTYMKNFVTTAYNELMKKPAPEPEAGAGVESVTVDPAQKEVQQGTSFTFKPVIKMAEGKPMMDEVIWTVSDNKSKDTKINPDGVLTVGLDEKSEVIKVRATSAYDKEKYGEAAVIVLDKPYQDPTIDENLCTHAIVLGATGNPADTEKPQKAIDGDEGTKWCPGANLAKNQWMVVDLGAVKRIDRWQMIHAGKAEGTPYITKDYELQVVKGNPTPDQMKNKDFLANNDNWETVTAVRNNDKNEPVVQYNPGQVKGRYFRLYINDGMQGSSGWPAVRIFEFRLYGTDDATMNRVHNIIMGEMEHGKLEVDSLHVEEGVKVYVRVKPDEGYRLVKGSLKQNGVAFDDFFMMPAKDVTLTAEFEQGPPPAPTCRVNFQVTPEDATIVLHKKGGDVIPFEGNIVRVEIPGEYTYTVSKNGYEVKSGELNLTAADLRKVVVVELEKASKTTTITFDVTPADAVVTLSITGGAAIPFTGKSVTVSRPGYYTYTITRDGYETFTKDIEVEEQDADTLLIQETLQKNITPPEAVKNLVVTNTQREDVLKLTWDASEGAEGYFVYRKAEGETGLKYVYLTKNTLLFDTLKAEGKYSYVVFAFNMSGEKRLLSKASELVTGTVSFRPEPPAALTNLQVRAESEKAILTWDASENADYYEILRRAPGEEAMTLYKTTTETTFTDTAKSDAYGYYFYIVRPARSWGEKAVYGTPSSYKAVNLLPKVPGPVKVLNLRTVETFNVLSWDAVENAEEYRVFRKGPEDKGFELLKVTTATRIFDNVEDSGRYFYIVTPIRHYSGGVLASPSTTYAWTVVK